MSDSPTPDPLLDSLFASARAKHVDTSRAEYAFETRLVAKLRSARGKPAWGLAAWRMVPVFALVVLGLGIWRAEIGTTSQEAAQVTAAENPEAADMLASFN